MSIYLEMRQRAGLTQLESAGRTQELETKKKLDAAAISKIETGSKIPSRDEIVLLALIYEAPELLIHYCENICPLSSKANGLRKSTIVSNELVNSLETLQNASNHIYGILEDGSIEPAEWDHLLAIIKTLQDISNRIKALRSLAKAKSWSAPSMPVPESPYQEKPYAKARKNVYPNYTKAAQAVGIERSRLNRIETGSVAPYPEEINRMAEEYHAPELFCFYCTTECELTKIYGVDRKPLEYTSLDRISVRLMSALYYLDSVNEALADILSDNQIDAEEWDTLAHILKTLEKLAYSADSLYLWTVKQLAEHARRILADGSVTEQEARSYEEIIEKLRQLGVYEYIAFLLRAAN